MTCSYVPKVNKLHLVSSSIPDPALNGMPRHWTRILRLENSS